MSYICDGCMSHWKSGKFMQNCGICAGHRKNGWTPKKMVDVYSPMVESRQQHGLSVKIIPPRKDRAIIRRFKLDSYIPYKIYLKAKDYYCGGTKLTEQNKVDLKAIKLWPIPCSVGQHNAFCKQEKDSLSLLFGSRRAWNLLDPLTQQIVLFLLDNASL